jgi:hypothetical protein
MLVLDSGGVTALARRTPESAAILAALKEAGLWPPTVPTAVLIECLTASPTRDANTNRFLKTCSIQPVIMERTARRAAALRTMSGRGSAADALTVALAEPVGTVLTSDKEDLRALAANAMSVTVELV